MLDFPTPNEIEYQPHPIFNDFKEELKKGSNVIYRGITFYDRNRPQFKYWKAEFRKFNWELKINYDYYRASGHETKLVLVPYESMWTKYQRLLYRINKLIGFK